MGETATLKVKLAYWRTRRAMTVRALVQASGVSSSTIGKIENTPGYMPIPDVLSRLARALNITIGELVVDEEEEAHRKRARAVA